MATTHTTQQRLALAIIDFLNTSLTDGSLSPDEKDSIEVATLSIADSFKVDSSDKDAVAQALGPDQNLLKIYTVYEKLRGKNTPSTEGPSSAAEGRPTSPQTPATSAQAAAQKADAERLKGQGNVAMQQKDYKGAIEFYTKAIDITPTNPIYLSNRAAAYSGSQQHELAKQDAEMATAADPKYTKAWSRLGLANFALGDAKGSMEAYKKGIDAEGNGGSEAMKKGYETARRRLEEGGDDTEMGGTPRSTSPAAAGGPGGGGGMPDLGSLASMLGGGGGGEGGGGMPDLGGLMNNPMMRQMAQNVMQNPDMMSNLMNNPQLREMAGRFGGGQGGGGAGGEGAGQGGGSMPDLSAMMNDPNIAEMARNFMGGQGGGGGGGGGGAGQGGGS